MKEKLLAIVAFSLFLNFAVAIMIYAVPGFEGMDARLGLSQNDIVSNTNEQLFDSVGEPLSGVPSGEDSANLDSNTLADRIGLGSISGFLNLLNNLAYGFINVLQGMFGSYVHPYIFVVFKTIITFIYLIAAVEFFTGKVLN